MKAGLPSSAKPSLSETRPARRAGLAVRSSVDCLIAASGTHRGVTVLHRDRDYLGPARVYPLHQRNLAE